MVYRRMRQLAGRGASDLDDLVQLAAEQVFCSLPSFARRSDLTTWVYTICYRVLLRHRRFYKRFRLRFSLEDEEQLQLATDETPAAAIEAWDRARRLHAALSRLSDKYRAVVVLHDLEELAIGDIARIVDTGELTVRSRLRDGRKQLRKLLDADAANAPYGGQHELTPT
jgi:RNA polymerase sigma-70 factor (ECF subfamily)